MKRATVRTRRDIFGSGLLGLRRAARQEDGNIILLTLFMLIPMLIVGGMAVDFMRFESRRAALQGVTDRAVLAAANLRSTQDAKAVVVDYFTKNGMADQLDGDPIVTPGYKRREVTANARFELNTFFLNLLDINTLTAPATSSAVQGVGAVEVSLVLDLSGSMYEVIPNTNPKVRRIDKLISAATSFNAALLKPEFENRISISLVPYSEQVNIGPDLFNKLKVNQDHNFSYCLEMPASAYKTTTFDLQATYDQTQAIQSNPYGNIEYRDYNKPDHDQPVCPRNSFEQIVPISQDLAKLNANISNFKPRSGTSIFLGMKWGVSLLDPSFGTVISSLPSSVIDPYFADRPAPYEPDKSKGDTLRSLKYLVLMTDGFNDNSSRIKPEYYDDPSERAYWAYNNGAYAFYNSGSPLGGGMGYYNEYSIRNTYLEPWFTRDQGNEYMEDMCDAAKDAGIVIYAISMSGGDDRPEAVVGRDMMRDCATTPNHFFATSGQELDEIFERIAKQITDLRLTL